MKLTSLMRIWLTKSFQPFLFQSTYNNNLDYENISELGLYVHIPFCKSICSFCPYCKVLYDEDTVRKYEKALIKEIEIVGSQLHKPKEVTSLYFGGGTPALMVDNLGKIINTLKKYFVIKQGIGVELHPDDINESLLSTLKTIGVTMISIGAQSFNKECLSTLGRKNQDFTSIYECIGTADFDVVDTDLIFGIPHQNKEMLISDITTAFKNGSTQISTYPFIDFTFAYNKYKPLPERQKKEMLEGISDYCRKANLDRTSVWTFAKKNTNKYSSITRNNFLGFGVSATTLLKDQFKINTFSIEGYIDRVELEQLPTSLTLSFSLRQRAVYYLFWSAYGMCISPSKFEDYFGIPLSKVYGFEIWLCQRFGLIEKVHGDYHLTNRGAYYYHYIEQTYTTSYIDKMWNISRKIAFPKEIVLY